MNKAFIAKLLVLCMIVGLLPTVALAAGGSESTNAYQINTDVTNGTVEVYYQIGSDVNHHTLNSAYYTINGDVTSIEVEITPNDGYRLVSASYQINGGEAVTFTSAEENGRYKIPTTEPCKIGVHATFELIPTSGGGGGTSSADTVTGVGDATTGDESSVVEVEASARVSRGTATASVNDRHLNDAVNKAIAAAEENETAPVIDIVVDTKDAKALKLTLGSDALDTLGANPNAVLKVTSDAANLEFNASAIESLGDQATGNIVITVAPATGLSDAQKEAVGESAVYEISITAGGKQITDFDSGTLTVGLPHKLAEGQKESDVQVYYLDGTEMFGRTTSYKDGVATFTTEHLSHYVIGDKNMSKALAVAADVKSSDWFAEAVNYVYSNKLMNGKPNGFDPTGTTTRAEVVTTLYRLANSPKVTGESKFEDVEADQWYTDAVIWAAENEVVLGTSDTTFSPKDVITREQMATMLYRYTEKVAKKSVSKTAELTAYTDAESVHDWALAAVKWANAEGLMKGTSSTTLTPGKDMSRAELATFLMRFDKNIVK